MAISAVWHGDTADAPRGCTKVQRLVTPYGGFLRGCHPLRGTCRERGLRECGGVEVDSVIEETSRSPTSIVSRYPFPRLSLSTNENNIDQLAFASRWLVIIAKLARETQVRDIVQNSILLLLR